MAEQRYDSLRFVVGNLVLVETVEQFHLRSSRDVNVAQVGLAQEASQSGLVALHELGYQRLGVCVGGIFRPSMILIADGIGCQTERHFQGEVAELYGLHGFSHQLGVAKHLSPPCKQSVALQVEVGHQVAIGIEVVFATTGHLFLAGFQEV